jgi:hypothetical protein
VIRAWRYFLFWLTKYAQKGLRQFAGSGVHFAEPSAPQIAITIFVPEFFRQTKALNPVMDLPTIKVFISLVPS